VRLLERGLTHDLGADADVRLDFAEDGVRAALRFRVGEPMLARAGTP
jgi:hypothetical protein